MVDTKKKNTEKHAPGQKDTSRAIHAEEKEPFSKRMERLVQMCGSASELARLADVSESAIRKWKMGESEPTVDRLMRLARATGVDVAWLASGEGTQTYQLRDSGTDYEVVRPPVYIYKEGFSPEHIEGVILLVERHEATRAMPAEQKARFIRELFEHQEREMAQGRAEAKEMLRQGPPQSKE